MLKTLPKKGDTVRYLGGEEAHHENATECLTVGKEYEITGVQTGLIALLVSGTHEMAEFKDDSPSKKWTICEDEFEYYELVSE